MLQFSVIACGVRQVSDESGRGPFLRRRDYLATSVALSSTWNGSMVTSLSLSSSLTVGTNVFCHGSPGPTNANPVEVKMHQAAIAFHVVSDRW